MINHNWRLTFCKAGRGLGLRSGVEAESFESWYSSSCLFCRNDSWLLQNFSSRFMIHEDFWSPIDLMIQSQWQLNLVLFSFFGVQTSVSCSVFIHTRYNHSFCSGVEKLNIKHQSNWRNKRTVSPECSNYIRGGLGACSPGNIFENWTLGNAISRIPWIERN